MTRKKIIKRIFFTLLVLLPVAAIAHYIVFPQQSRSILIAFSGFEKDGRIYHRETAPKSKIDTLKALIERANARVSNFWGSKESDATFIYCNTQADFSSYSSAPDAPAITYCKLGSHIVLSADGVDLDIIAHEISHAELYERIGFYKWTFSIPAWFKHGLAMQNDYRNYYSEDTLKVKTGNLKNLPNIKNLTTDNEFYTGSVEQIMLHYMAAKYVVKNWYTKQKLNTFIKELNDGKSFNEAFGQ